MGYAVKADMVTRFREQEIIQLTDEQGLGVIDTDALDQALLDADAEIDGYIGSQVTLPLATVPRILVGYACDIARYKLYTDDAPEQVRDRYDDAIKFLSLVGQGKLSLGVDTNSEPVATSGGVKSTAPDRVFNADNLAGF